ncbi:phage integrase [Vreelandella venusta]|uniref:Phage integrase n=1 Tax=Halomonas hydrothermalis TaxID=115561 RepID=A0A6F8U2L3_9GAMM|nr:integrase arm-type DNA-binding domain-containing protein [Halomonas hydrothermalis]BCB07897.1 phage integrase [Halomonas hydrothermalis]
MPRQAKPLTAMEVKRLTQPGFYAVGEVPGLHLQVTKTGARSWVLRYATGDTRLAQSGKTFKVRRDMGLGGYPGVSLAQARDKARAVREKLDAGIDPVIERKSADQSRRAAELARITFADAAYAVIKMRKAESSNKKHGEQWRTTLETYAFPVLGKMAVSDIELVHVKQVLQPIWETKTETAKRVRQRIESVLNWATVHGHRQGDNPARLRGHLDTVLPKIKKVGNHPALPYDRVAEFMADLRNHKSMAARALEFTILTAARIGEVIGEGGSSPKPPATWGEINLEQCVWIIPAARMKAKREHRVPLSDDAVALLKALPHSEDTNVIFPSPQKSNRANALSNTAIRKLIANMHTASMKAGAGGYTDPKQENKVITIHGFRSTFRDWMAECTATPHDVAEMALAHTIKSGAEAAYRRGDMLAKRARVMDQWAAYVTTPAGAGNVGPIRGEVTGL